MYSNIFIFIIVTMIMSLSTQQSFGFKMRMHAPISSNLDFDDEQELPKITTSNTPVSISSTIVLKDPNPQSPTEPNHMAPNYYSNTPSGRTSKVSKNLDFETNYIDPTTAMTVTIDKNHPQPPDEENREKEKPVDETLIKGNDVDSSDSKPPVQSPQANSNEESKPSPTSQPEEVKPETTLESKPNPEKTEESKPEESKPDSIPQPEEVKPETTVENKPNPTTQPEKTEEIKPDLTPKSETNEDSNLDLKPGPIEENKSTSESKSDESPKEESNSSISEEIGKSCNESTEVLPTVEVYLVDMKSQTEPNQEGMPVSTVANSGTENSESTEKPSVSAQPGSNIATEIENSCKTAAESSQSSSSCTSTDTAGEASSSDPTKSDVENNKPDMLPTLGTIEEVKPEVVPETKTEIIPDEKEKTDVKLNTEQPTNSIEKSSSPDQSETAKSPSEDSVALTAVASGNEIVPTTSNAIIEPINNILTTPSTPTINDNEHTQVITSPKPKPEQVDAITSVAKNPAENEVIQTNERVKESNTTPKPSNTNESTNDKIVDKTENASTTIDSSIVFILPLVCSILLVQ